MATAKELRELSVEDLDKRATETREQLFQDQLKRRTGSLDNPSERTTHRRDLARLLTVKTEKTPRKGATTQVSKTDTKA